MWNWLLHLIFGHQWTYSRPCVTKRACTYCCRVEYQHAYGDARLFHGLSWRVDPPYNYYRVLDRVRYKEQHMSERTAAYETFRLSGYMLDEPAKPGLIYVIADTGIARHIGPSVQYLCPCGCGKEIYLPCYTDDEPRSTEPKWKLSLTGNECRVTLHPSIQDNGPCRSHYHIRDGKVEWC